ncbi:MAG: hemin uptake protein HemP [Acidovorax sp.]|nr:hemin uptake protein HemP [Acidovorax sp.]
MQASLTATSFFAPASFDGPAQRQELAQQGEMPAGAVDSNELLKGQKAVTIVHNGSLYRLQATKLGKLILTK